MRRQEELVSKVAYLEKKIAAKRAVRELLKEQKEDSELKLQELEKQEALYKEACILLGRVSDHTQDDIKQHFEIAGTLILQSIFGPSYRFEVELSKGNLQNSSLGFSVATPYGEDDTLSVDPLNDSGGLRDVIGFALRLAFLKLAKNHGVLFLDECFRQLSSVYISNMVVALKLAHEELNHQILLVTHDNRLLECADKVITLKKQHSVSTTGGKPS